MLFGRRPQLSDAFFALFLAGIFLMPFVYGPSINGIFEVARVWFVLRWIEVLAVLFLLTNLQRFWQKKTSSIQLHMPLLGTLLLFTLIATVTAVLGVDVQKSILGNFYRADGLLVLYHLVGLSVMVGVMWRKSWRWPWIVTMILSAVGISLWYLLSLFLPTARIVLLSSAVSFGQVKYLAGYLAVTFPFLLVAGESLFKSSKKNSPKTKILTFLFLLALLAQSLALFFTKTYGAYLAVLLALGVWFFLQKLPKLLFPFLVLVTAVGVAGVAFWFARPHAVNPEGRERIFHKLLLAVEQRPLTGWGWANIDRAFDATTWPYPMKHDVFLDKAHAVLLEVLVATGGVGLTAYLLMVSLAVFVLWRIIRRKKTVQSWECWCLTFFLVFLFHAQTNVISIAEEVPFWIVIGFSLGISSRRLDSNHR